MGFYELLPQYECKYEAGWKSCTNEDFCPEFKNSFGKIESLPEYRIVTNAPTSLNNWIQTYDLECSSKSVFGLFGSLYFLGLLSTCLFVTRLSDIYGRRNLFIWGTSLHIISSIVIIFSTSLELTFMMIFFQGLAHSGRGFVGILWMNENTTVKMTSMVTSLTFGIDGLNEINRNLTRDSWTQMLTFLIDILNETHRNLTKDSWTRMLTFLIDILEI